MSSENNTNNNKKKRSINDVLMESSSKHHWRTNINTDELIFEFVPECNELQYDEDDKSSVGTCGKGVALALGNTVMRSGKHFVTFERSGCEMGLVYMGIMRPVSQTGLKGKGSFSPIWEKYEDLLQKTPDRWGDGNVHTCMTELTTGARSTKGLWNDGTGKTWDTKKNKRQYEEEYSEPQTNTTLALLLDLDVGTLTLYEVLKSGKVKNKGILKDGLTGEYCWATEIIDNEDGVGVQIKKGDIPSV